MLRTRGISVSVLAAAVGVTLACAPAAVAAPTPAPQTPMAAAVSDPVPMVPEGVPIDALASLVPAIVGAIATGHTAGAIASPGQQAILDQARTVLAGAPLPPQVKQSLQGVITFLDGSGGGGPAVPYDGPAFAQFLYPSIGRGCIGPQSDSVATALAVPGPADLPLPGPQSGQTGFVLTALGTHGPTPVQNPLMTVQWLNLDTGRTGIVPLTDELHINPDGPATLSAIADTGRGRVVAVVAGSLTTAVADEAPITCSFIPTMGFFMVN
ncbi:Rv1157c family protein [Nocardia aurantia]|uniref:Rv1157c family protein n=1 Tax=Nocardia aurantia TaxID=2585199 RepID=UPI0029E80B5C|nr:hypothetical protein [Nocardia aurantia]